MNITITGGTGFITVDFNDLTNTYGYSSVTIPSNYTPLLAYGEIIEFILYGGKSLKIKATDVELPINNGTALDLKDKIINI